MVDCGFIPASPTSIAVVSGSRDRWGDAQSHGGLAAHGHAQRVSAFRLVANISQAVAPRMGSPDDA